MAAHFYSERMKFYCNLNYQPCQKIQNEFDAWRKAIVDLARNNINEVFFQPDTSSYFERTCAGCAHARQAAMKAENAK